MASGTRFLVVAATLTLCSQCANCTETEFDVGERGGWSVPAPNDTAFYDNWASRKRFKVGDTIRFKYKKDSVMEVSKRDYKECNSSRPNFFSNSGNTMYHLDRSGFFYFISGATGHCEMGQRMIVWVVGQDTASPHPTSTSNTPTLTLTLNLNPLIFSFPFPFLLIIANAAFSFIFSLP